MYNKQFKRTILAATLLSAAALAAAPAAAQSKLNISNGNISASSSDANLPANANDGSLTTRWSADADLPDTGAARDIGDDAPGAAPRSSTTLTVWWPSWVGAST